MTSRCRFLLIPFMVASMVMSVARIVVEICGDVDGVGVDADDVEMLLATVCGDM